MALTQFYPRWQDFTETSCRCFPIIAYIWILTLLFHVFNPILSQVACFHRGLLPWCFPIIANSISEYSPYSFMSLTLFYPRWQDFTEASCHEVFPISAYLCILTLLFHGFNPILSQVAGLHRGLLPWGFPHHCVLRHGHQSHCTRSHCQEDLLLAGKEFLTFSFFVIRENSLLGKI